MRVQFPADGPGSIGVHSDQVPGQPPQLPLVQPPPQLTVRQRQYPNIPRHWFSSNEAHDGMSRAMRSLFDMNYDLQDSVRILVAAHPGLQVGMQPLGGSGAVNPSQRAHYLITSPSVAALTLGAPRAGTDDGTEITCSSATAHAHTITATGLLATGSAAVNLATFAAFAGASLHLRAQNGKWNIMSSNGVVFT